METLDDPLRDGRQSGPARVIARGTARLLAAHGMTVLPEVTFASGRRADLVGLDRQGAVHIIEIKSSIEDFRADRKWPDYRAYCDRLFFAVDEAFPVPVLPADTGLIVADRHGAALLRDAPHHPLAGARRRAVHLMLARLAGARLMRLADPGLVGLGEFE